MFSSSPFIFSYCLCLLRFLFPFLIPVFFHACFCSYHVISFFMSFVIFMFYLLSVITLFISPVIFHVCFIERCENKWTMEKNIFISYTKNDSGHIQKWKWECKKWNNDLIVISILWLPKILIRFHEFAEPIRSVLPSRQVPRKEIQLWRKDRICRPKFDFKDSWRHFKGFLSTISICLQQKTLAPAQRLDALSWGHEFRKAPKADSFVFETTNSFLAQNWHTALTTTWKIWAGAFSFSLKV